MYTGIFIWGEAFSECFPFEKTVSFCNFEILYHLFGIKWKWSLVTSMNMAILTTTRDHTTHLAIVIDAIPSIIDQSHTQTRQPTIWLHDLCLEVLTVHGNELHLYGVKVFPLLLLCMLRIWHSSGRYNLSAPSGCFSDAKLYPKKINYLLLNPASFFWYHLVCEGGGWVTPLNTTLDVQWKSYVLSLRSCNNSVFISKQNYFNK